jgi:hypothetical protein
MCFNNFWNVNLFLKKITIYKQKITTFAMKLFHFQKFCLVLKIKLGVICGFILLL